MSSKPSLGRDVTDDTQSVCVSKCGSSKCKACVHIMEGSCFTSNTKSCTYSVMSPVNGSVLNCCNRNIIYLISCSKCRVQYVGKTSQTLHSRLNNHRNRLKQMLNLYL